LFQITGAASFLFYHPHLMTFKSSPLLLLLNLDFVGAATEAAILLKLGFRDTATDVATHNL